MPTPFSLHPWRTVSLILETPLIDAIAEDPVIHSKFETGLISGSPWLHLRLIRTSRTTTRSPRYAEIMCQLSNLSSKMARTSPGAMYSHENTNLLHPSIPSPLREAYLRPLDFGLPHLVARQMNSSRWFLSSLIPKRENGDQRETFPGSPNLIFIFYRRSGSRAGEPMPTMIQQTLFLPAKSSVCPCPCRRKPISAAKSITKQAELQRLNDFSTDFKPSTQSPQKLVRFRYRDFGNVPAMLSADFFFFFFFSLHPRLHVRAIEYIHVLCHPYHLAAPEGGIVIGGVENVNQTFTNPTRHSKANNVYFTIPRKSIPSTANANVIPSTTVLRTQYRAEPHIQKKKRYQNMPVGPGSGLTNFTHSPLITLFLKFSIPIRAVTIPIVLPTYQKARLNLPIPLIILRRKRYCVCSVNSTTPATISTRHPV
ncbi:hypothetical protein CCUS01_06600 [Colletotrichum cuscutae]|uniref:Uncharacterized protein n=1 Tax=Colletotrichum cuscutae TaxID=1209917 RepID=A0AAI9V7J7_9PEZI|nr:hypothetical protein CCUS01_06600 [Colletotrichum cuscutae]